MSISGIQGQLLEITVVGCQKLKNTEWISRQDPYVCVEYGGTKYRTRTCTDGGKNPTFQEKFVFTLIEGLRELKISVWNSNTLTTDDFIGNGTVHMQKVLSQGYDDCAWTLQTKTGRYAGEVRLIMHYAGAKKPGHASAPSAPPYITPVPQASLYSGPPATAPSPYASAPPYSVPAPFPQYPPASYSTASPYPQPSAYPPHPSTYPPSPSSYPPPPSAYAPPPPFTSYPPPPSQASPYYAPGPYPGLYPPPPY